MIWVCTSCGGGDEKAVDAPASVVETQPALQPRRSGNAGRTSRTTLRGDHTAIVRRSLSAAAAPADNDGYFSCGCVALAGGFTPEDRELWSLKYDHNLQFVVRDGQPAVRATVWDRGDLFKYEPNGDTVHVHAFTPAVRKMVDLGPATMEGLCAGAHAQRCAVRLESAPYYSAPTLKIPRTLALTLYDDSGRVSDELLFEAGH